jgi:hypothetical protein
MHTPWGRSDYQKQFRRGVTWVSTPSHGGFMIAEGTARELLSAAAIAEGELCCGYLAFEEDCDAAIVLYELPETREGFSNTSDAELIASLSAWNLPYLRARGIEPDAQGAAFWQERHEEERMRAEKSPDLIIAGFGDWAEWVPAGRVGLCTADGKRYTAPAAAYDARKGLNLLSKLVDVQEVARA